MADFLRSDSLVFIPHQQVTRPGSVIGSEVAFATRLSLQIVCYHAPVDAVANTEPGNFLIQSNPSAAPDNQDWATVARFAADTGLPQSEPIGAVVNPGDTLIPVTDTTGFTAGDPVYIRDFSVVTDGEWGRIRRVQTGLNMTMTDGVANAHDTLDTIFTQAEAFVFEAQLYVPSRWRVIFEYESSAGPSDVHIKATGVTIDSFQ